MPIANPISALERGSCENGDLVISIYANEGAVQAQVEFYQSLGKELDGGADTVAGLNWTVHTSDDADLDRTWKALGGRHIQ